MWRLRTVVKSEVVVSIGEAESLDAIFKIFPIDNTNTENAQDISETVRYCDALLKQEVDDIYEAFALLYNELNNFLDRISLVSYGSVTIVQIFSICPDSILAGHEFDIAIPQFSTQRKTKAIQLESLHLKSVFSPEQQRWTRLLRSGLNSSSEEEKFINYYSLLEEIARQESEEYIVTKCTNSECLKEVNTGRKATNNFIRGVLKNHNLDKELVKKAPVLRNKIAHGGAKKDKEYLSDIRKVGSHLEEICLLELENRLPVEIINRLNAHIIDIPIAKHRCICNDDSFDLIRSTQTIPARFVKLKTNNEDGFEDQSTGVGMPLDKDGRPFINPFSWPKIEKKSNTGFSELEI